MQHPTDAIIAPDTLALSLAVGAFGAFSRDAVLTFAVGALSPLIAPLLRAVFKPIVEAVADRIAAGLRRRLSSVPTAPSRAVTATVTTPAVPRCVACGRICDTTRTASTPSTTPTTPKPATGVSP